MSSLSATFAFGQQCLRTVTHFVPASLAAFYRIDEHLQACDFQLLNMGSAMHSDYLEHYRHLDPLQPENCMALATPVVSLRDGMRQQDIACNREYQRFLLHHAVVDVVEVIVQLDERPLAGLSLLRNTALGPFRAQELESLLPLHGLMQQGAGQLAAPKLLSTLTPRERQIALLLREGASNKVLARELDLGLPTIKTHLLNLFRKVGVSNRTELMARLFL